MNLDKFKSNLPQPRILAQAVSELSKLDMQELCESTEEAIIADGGFGWINPPARKKLEDYWKGVLLIPERILIIGKFLSIYSV